MAKKKSFTLHSSLPVQELHGILSSERYLLTTEGMENAQNSRVEASQREIREDGTVAARVHMVSGGMTTTGEEGEEASTPEVHAEQTTTVSPISDTKRGPGFRFNTIMALPAGLGTLFTDMEFYPDAEGTGSDVQAEMRVDTKVPVIGAKFAKSMLAKSEETVGNGLRRAERLAEFPLGENASE